MDGMDGTVAARAAMSSCPRWEIRSTFRRSIHPPRPQRRCGFPHRPNSNIPPSAAQRRAAPGCDGDEQRSLALLTLLYSTSDGRGVSEATSMPGR
jgi:hypothetical protein